MNTKSVDPQVTQALLRSAMELDPEATLLSLAEWKAANNAVIASATTLPELEEVRVESVGKLGVVTSLLKTLGRLPPELRTLLSPAYNQARIETLEEVNRKKTALEVAELDARLAREKADVTLPAAPIARGTIHPVSQVMDELAEIFADLGFSVATGPEIESDWFNFTALNFPPDHPARAMHDTFYLDRREGEAERMLLRTHTSPVQIRAMAAKEPPLYIIAPGRVYRSDSDATHTPMFHQVEGLVIDRGITLGHLKWTLETFLNAFFEREDIVLRLRPSFVPFPEPSVEVDVGYTLQKGRRVLGGSDHWMELLGSGMVHPNVIRNCGLDPDEWQGFAFGVGIDRLAMLKYGMDDLRAFFDGDLRWLQHYGFGALDVPTLSGGVGA